MTESISTKEFPIRFFQYFFLQDGLQMFIDECIEKWFEIKDRNPNNVDIIHTGSDIVMQHWYSRFPGEEGFLDSHLSNLLVDLLKDEVERSKDLLIEAITFYHYTVKDFINIQLMIIKEVIAKEKLINESTNVKTYLNGFKYSICEPYLNNLLEYILDLDVKIANIDNNTKQETRHSTEIVNQTTSDPINEVLGYLIGKNQDGFQIMTEKEYNRLIKTINHIKDHNEIPLIKDKFRINEKVGILKYTFYALVPIMGNSKELFIQFLVENIYEFRKWKLDNFKTKFSVPPTVRPHYLPQIIREKKQPRFDRQE